ncbi:cholinergic receptor, nicotinic, partial [Cichlidogyrus casuarinus]
LTLNFEGQGKLNLDYYFVSGSWDLVEADGVMEIGKVGGQKGKAQIIYTLKLRRKTLFYTVNLILPCIMISLLSICVFYLPADAGEKMTLSISILFALVVFLLLICKILPPTSTSIPLISKYLLFTFIINIFAIMVTVLIINWNYRTTRTHSVPKWVRRLFMELLPRLLMMRRPVNVEMELKLRSYLLNRNHQRNESWIINDHAHACKYWPAGGRSTINQVAPTSDSSSEEFCQFCSNNLNESSCSSDGSGETAQNADVRPIDPAVCLTGDLSEEQHKMLKTCVKKASSAISYISAKLHDDSEYELVYGDWKYVASVIDRLMLVLFVVVNTVGTFCIFIRAPYLFDKFDQQAFKEQLSMDKLNTALP